MTMRNAPFCWLAFCALAVTFGCRAPSRPPSANWNGTWKLNLPESSYQGPVITVSISPHGEYRYDDGSSSFTFRCDGKNRPVGENRTRSCVKRSATALELVQKEDGLKTSARRWELSAGGSVLTATATTFRPNGPVITGEVIAQRISGLNDFAGQWRDESYVQEHAELTLSLDAQTLHIGYPNAGQYIDAPFDGAEVAVHGSHAPPAVTYAARLIGPREFLTLAKRDGKVVSQDSLQLSVNGRVITETWWNPDHPTGKSTFVYEKQ